MGTVTKKLCYAFLLIGFSVGHGAAIAGGWGAKVTTVTGYYTWADGNAHFRVADMENPDKCIVPNYLTLDANSLHYKELYATLMTAHTSGKTVQLSYNGCTAGNQYPIVNAIAVPNIW